MSLFDELKRRNVFRVAIAYTVTAWLVAQVAELALDSFQAPEWVIKTLLLFLALGLPFAIIFAWAFELTPEGLKREKDVDRTQSITSQTGRRIDFVIIGVLAIALIFAVSTHQWTGSIVSDEETSTFTGDQSIAVLPFENMSDDPDNEYFSDGISEELLNVLVKVEGLRVASRTSSFSFKGKDIGIPEIAANLGVENVLEGSVRKAGNKVRITAQLIDVKTDSHLWSETYDRELTDIFVVQDEISAAIVDALARTLGAGGSAEALVSSKSTENIEAYELYLRGRYFWQRRGEDVLKAADLFEQATDLDPKFARAWSSLAAAHITIPTYTPARSEVHHPLAEQFALKALALDDSLAEAHAVIGELSRAKRDWIDAEEHYQAAIKHEPSSSTAHLWYAEHLQCTGRIDESLEHALIAYELDPLHPGSNQILSEIYESHGDNENWLRLANDAWDLGHPIGLLNIIEHHIRLGDYEEARATLENHEDKMPEGFYGYMTHRIDAYTETDGLIKYINKANEMTDRRATFIVTDLVHFGLIDESFERIGDARAYSMNGWFDLWRSDVSALRSDPRFLSVVENANWVEYWDAYGWPPFCERVDGEIRCR